MPRRAPTDAAATEPLGDAFDLLRLMWLLDHHVQRRSKLMGSTLGVTAPQRMVVRLLGRRPGLSAGELADLLHLHPSTMTGILRRLERTGYVQRRGDSRDGRRACFTLTDAGKRIDAHRRGTLESAVADVVDDVSPQQLNATRKLLGRLVASLASDD